MDDRKQRVVVSEDGGEGVGFYGWEVADAAALQDFAARLEKAGVQVARGSRALADERRVKDLIVLADPLGNRLEIFHGAETATDAVQARPLDLGLPHRAARHGSRRAARQGHQRRGAVLSRRARLPAVATTCCGRSTPISSTPIRATTPSPSSRPAATPPTISWWSCSASTTSGSATTWRWASQDRIGVTLGRHINDEVTSFYSNSPSGFMVEYGWGGRVIDVDTWQTEEVTFGPSMWGHDRLWMTPEKRAEARAIRIEAAASGLRKPVNVIEGNYKLAPGVCPWWDGVMRGEAAE